MTSIQTERLIPDADDETSNPPIDDSELDGEDGDDRGEDGDDDEPAGRLYERVLRQLTPTRAAAALLAVEAMLAFYLVRPLLWSGYTSDDATNSQSPAWRLYRGVSLWHEMTEQNSHWMRNNGRFFPGSIFETQIIFNIWQTRAAYKVVQVVFILLAVAVVVLFFGVFLRSIQYAAVAGWLMLLTLQFRAFYDPLTSFTVQQPTVVILLFASLTLATVAARTRSRKLGSLAMAAAVVCWSLGLVTYETLYPMVLIPLAILWIECDGRRRVVGLVAFIVPTLMLVAYATHLRMNALAPTSGYELNLQPWRAIPAWFYQGTGIVPFSYPALANQDLPRTIGTGIVGTTADWLALLLGVIAVALFTRLRLPHIGAPSRRLLGWGGALLIFVPTTIISLTKRWQDAELQWGLPYVSVFVSAIGLVMLEVAVIATVVSSPTIRQRFRTGWRRVAALMAGGVAALIIIGGPLYMYDLNYWAVQVQLNFRTDRERFIGFVEDGVFDDVPAKSIVITDAASTQFWENGAIVQYYGGPAGLQLVLVDSPEAAACGVAYECHRLVTTLQPDGSIIAEMQPFSAAV
jgi:hypothetical protein